MSTATTLHPSTQFPTSPATLGEDLLVAIAQGLARAPSLWQGLAGHDAPGRHAVRLLATEGYEAWVIGWPPGHRTTPHDHGGSAATLAVVEGELVELDADGDGHRRLVPDTAVALAADVIHDVGNESGAPATSVHVYSPPLTTMTYYDADGSPDTIVGVVDEIPVHDVRRIRLGLPEVGRA